MYDDAYPTCDATFASLRIFEDANRPVGISSEGVVDSKDLRRHVDWLLEQIEHDESLRERVLNTRSDVMCFWSSAYGHGGPTLSPIQMKKLGEYGLELWIDFYDADDASEP